MEPEEMHSQGVSEHTGFPNAATDSQISSLDLNKLLIRHPWSTFYLRIRGTAGKDYNLGEGDIIVVDRSLKPKPSDLVVWWDSDAFSVSTAKKIPSNNAPWGVITHAIHVFRGKK